MTEVNYVKAKKYLGQHFLKDRNSAHKITEALDVAKCTRVIENRQEWAC